MAKGGRYLNTNKKEKKKGRGWKVLVIILLILALLAGGGYFAFRTFMGSMLGNVNRAEFEEKNQDKSYDDLMAELYGNAEVSGGDGEEEDGDFYIPEPQDGEALGTISTETGPAETDSAG